MAKTPLLPDVKAAVKLSLHNVVVVVEEKEGESPNMKIVDSDSFFSSTPRCSKVRLVSGSSSVRKIDLIPRHTMKMLVSLNNRQLVLVGNSSLRLVDVPAVGELSVTELSVRPVDSHFFEVRGRVKIVDALFSPFSNDSLIVLTTEPSLRLYALDAPEVEDAEQVVSFPPGSQVSRIFVPPVRVNEGIWDPLTVCVLLKDGTILSVCPVLPHRAVVSAQLLYGLRKSLEAQMQSQERSREQWTVLQWLSEIGADLVSDEDHSSVRPVRTRTPLTLRLRTLAVSRHEWMSDDFRCDFSSSRFSDVLAVSADAPNVFVLSAEGNQGGADLFFLVHVVPFEPRWVGLGEDAERLVPECTSSSAFFLHSIIHVESESEDGVAASHLVQTDGVGGPFLFPFPFGAFGVGVPRSRGLHAVEAPWIPQLCALVREDADATFDVAEWSERVNSLPDSVCAPLSLIASHDWLDRLQDIAAFRSGLVLSQTARASHVLALFTEEGLESIPLSSLSPAALTRLLSTLRSVTDVFVPQDESQSQSVGQRTVYWEPFLAHLQKVLQDHNLVGDVSTKLESTGSVGESWSVELLKYLVRSTGQLKSGLLKKGHVLLAETNARMDFLDKMGMQQERDIERAEDNLKELSTEMEYTKSSMRSIETVQDGLNRRAEQLFSRLAAHSDHLSYAERVFGDHVNEYKRNMRIFSERLMELKRLEAELPRSVQAIAEEDVGLSKSTLKKVQSALQSEVGCIKDHAELLESLTNDVDGFEICLGSMKISE